MVIGSRGSTLARWQANWLRERLEHAGHAVKTRVIKTSGDRLHAAPLASSGIKGLFVREIEEALLARAIDLAMHSLKDLPIEQPEGLYIAAVPEREDPRDVLVTRDGRKLVDLAPGARVGTGSLRRQVQLRSLRPDLHLAAVRGNVETRLAKLDRGEWDALVLAAAGLLRLGLGARIAEWFDPSRLCPPAGQGVLAIEIRSGDMRAAEAVRGLEHQPTRRCFLAERAVLKELGGGCAIPMGAYAVLEGSTLRLRAIVGSIHGDRLLRAEASGPADGPEALGASVAASLAAQGAREALLFN